MKSETTPFVPNLDPAETISLSDGTVSKNLQDQEAIRLDFIKLAEHLVETVDSSQPSATKKYLNDVISDSEKLGPSPETVVAFSYLSGEQRVKIRQNLLTSGFLMLDRLDFNLLASTKTLSQTGNEVRSSVQTVLDTHSQEVGKYFKGQIDTYGADRGHETVSQAARRGTKNISLHVDEFDNWAKSQQQVTLAYSYELKHGIEHEKALTQAIEVVKPSYEGKSKDLTSLIDEEVKDLVATKIEAVVLKAKQDGNSPLQAVLDLITKEPETPPLLLLEILKDFTEGYYILTVAGNTGVKATAEEIEYTLKTFIRLGHGRYPSISQAQEAFGIYKDQQRRIEKAIDEASVVISRTEKVLEGAAIETKKVRAKITV